MSAFNSSQKLWRVIKERERFYYEIKLKGEVVDRLPVDEPALSFLKKEEVIK